MTAKVISLCDYRRNRDAEKRSKNVRGLGFPDDFTPFLGPDDMPEDFGILGLNLSLDNPNMHHQNFPFPVQGIKFNPPPEEEE